MIGINSNVEYYDDIISIFEPAFAECLFSTATDEEKEIFVIEALSLCDISFERLSSDISVGVSNGYSVAEQIKLCKKILF